MTTQGLLNKSNGGPYLKKNRITQYEWMDNYLIHSESLLYLVYLIIHGKFINRRISDCPDLTKWVISVFF